MLPLALSVALLAAPSVGEAIPLDWSAPAECPQDGAVRDAIDLNLAQSEFSDDIDRVAVAGAITGEQGAWRLEVRTTLLGGEVARVIENATCAPLAEAAGLIVAVDLDPLRVVETTNAARAIPDRPPNPVTPEPVPETTPEAPPKLNRPAPPPEDPTPLGRAVSIDLRVGVLGEIGSITVPRLGGWLGLGIAGRRFRVDVAGQYWAPRRVLPFEDHPDSGLQLQLAGLAARACFVPRARRRSDAHWGLEFATCGGGEVGVAFGRGVGLGDARRSSSPWLAAVIGQELSWIPGRVVGLWTSADAMLHIVRPRWTVSGLGEVVQTRTVGFRLVLGPTFRF